MTREQGKTFRLEPIPPLISDPREDYSSDQQRPSSASKSLAMTKTVLSSMVIVVLWLLWKKKMHQDQMCTSLRREMIPLVDIGPDWLTSQTKVALLNPCNFYVPVTWTQFATLVICYEIQVLFFEYQVHSTILSLVRMKFEKFASIAKKVRLYSMYCVLRRLYTIHLSPICRPWAINLISVKVHENVRRQK